jgi:hypothetical protein
LSPVGDESETLNSSGLTAGVRLLILIRSDRSKKRISAAALLAPSLRVLKVMGLA